MSPSHLPDDFFKAKALEYPIESAPHKLAVALVHGTLTADQRRQIIESYGHAEDPALQALLLDWVLDYVRLALSSKPLASDIADAVALLKHALGISEGAFYEMRPAEIKAILCEQLEQILDDGVLENHEELAQAALQRTFDLGYDQYLALTRPLYERALEDIRSGLADADGVNRLSLERRHLSLRAVCELAVTQPRSLGGLR